MVVTQDTSTKKPQGVFTTVSPNASISSTISLWIDFKMFLKLSSKDAQCPSLIASSISITKCFQVFLTLQVQGCLQDVFQMRLKNIFNLF